MTGPPRRIHPVTNLPKCTNGLLDDEFLTRVDVQGRPSDESDEEESVESS